MTRLSHRYMWPLSGCLLLALVPVVVHSYFRVDVEDCNAFSTFLPQFAYVSRGAGHDAQIKDRFETSEVREGSFSAHALRFDFSVIRTYDAKRLYHRPEDTLVEHSIVATHGIQWAATGSGTVPIQRAYYDPGDPAIVVSYLLVYHSSLVANPYWAQLRAAPAELFTGRHPMTIFLIQARGPQDRLSDMENVEREWLLTSWQKYRSACMR